MPDSPLFSRVTQTLSWKLVTILTAILLFLHLMFFSGVGVQVQDTTTAVPSTSLPQSSTPQQKPPVIEISKDPTSEAVPAINHANLYKQPSIDPAKSQQPISNPTKDKFQVYQPYDSTKPDEYVAICMAVKNQSLDLTEFFVHHYHHLGIRRFYVMDDGSDPPLSSYDYPGIPRSVLTFTWMEPAHRVFRMQLTFYSWCIERYKKNHKWIAFLDADEFLEATGDETLNEVLESFEGNDTVGALGVNWRMHTSSGLLTRPESARKGFTTCITDDLEHNSANSDNTHIKTIIKTSKAGGPINPHKFQTAPGSVTVGENGDEVTSAAWRIPPTRNRLALHHYAVKSRAEFEEKVHRGNAMTDPKEESFWDKIENHREHEECPEMVVYEP